MAPKHIVSEASMSDADYSVPHSLGMPSAATITHELAQLPKKEKYKVDISSMQHCEPFGLLMLASALRRLKQQSRGIEFLGRDDQKNQGHSFANRMGFWWAVGESEIQPSPSANPDGSTIPISKIEVSTLYRKAGGYDPIRSGLVTKSADQAATALLGDDESLPAWKAISYSIREIFRNCIEHSQSNAIWFAANARKSKSDVQLAILDEGRGIRASLADSPQHQYASDNEAIQRSLAFGVTRNVGRKRSLEQEHKLREEFPDQPPSLWDNSGYGLTLTTKLCEFGGQYAVVSGTSCVAFLNGQVSSSACHEGTAVRLVLHSDRLEEALEKLGLEAKDGSVVVSGKPLITASMRLRLGL